MRMRVCKQQIACTRACRVGTGTFPVVHINNIPFLPPVGNARGPWLNTTPANPAGDAWLLDVKLNGGQASGKSGPLQNDIRMCLVY